MIKKPFTSKFNSTVLFATLLINAPAIYATPVPNSSPQPVNNLAMLQDWVGDYDFEEDAGKNAAGTQMMIDHHLTIDRPADRLTATLKSEGYQTDETILADVKVVGSTATLLFRSYGDGKTVNKFGVAQYKPGETLLRLKRKVQGWKREYLTTWVGFKLNNEHAPGDRVYFKRVR